jgi:hypothetical protein
MGGGGAALRYKFQDPSNFERIGSRKVEDDDDDDEIERWGPIMFSRLMIQLSPNIIYTL